MAEPAATPERTACAPGCLEKLAMEVERIVAAMELANVLADTKSQAPTP